MEGGDRSALRRFSRVVVKLSRPVKCNESASVSPCTWCWIREFLLPLRLASFTFVYPLSSLSLFLSSHSFLFRFALSLSFSLFLLDKGRSGTGRARSLSIMRFNRVTDTLSLRFLTSNIGAGNRSMDYRRGQVEVKTADCRF